LVGKILEQIMSINKDQVHGRAEHAKGVVKEAVGKIVGNKDMQKKGSIQQSIGHLQSTVGDAKSKIADALNAVKTS
jgi:uncharacterized protein YjbJ (UPF0337 family)